MTHCGRPAAGLPAVTFCVSAATEEFAGGEFREGGWPNPALNERPQTVVGEWRQVDVAGQAAIRAYRLWTLPLRRLLDKASSEADLHEIAAARGHECEWVRHAMYERAGA